MGAGLGQFVRKRRTTLGFTQEDVAEAAGIGRSHLSQIESGKIGLPNAEIRRRLAATLRVQHVDLLLAAGELSDTEVRIGSVPTPSELDDLAEALPADAREALFAVARQMSRLYRRGHATQAAAD